MPKMNRPRRNPQPHGSRKPETPPPAPTDGLVSIPEVSRQTGVNATNLYDWGEYLFPEPTDGLRGKNRPTKLYPEDLVQYVEFVLGHVARGGVRRECLHYNEWTVQNRRRGGDETAHYRSEC